MSRLLLAAIVAAIILMIVIVSNKFISYDIDGQHWNVLAKYSNSAAAAQYLKELNDKVMILLRSLRARYHIDVILEPGREHPELPTKVDRRIIEQLLTNYNPQMIFEANPMSSSDTSFTINKGESLHFCLRKRDNNQTFIEPNLMMFVTIHELAHVANYASWNHEIEFWEVFKFLLSEATIAGVYTPEDYAHNKKNYCGLAVSYNPFFDTSVRDLRIGGTLED